MAVHLSFVLILAGLTGIHSITTVSEVSVKPQASITIPCLYDPQYRNHVKYLCKGTLWFTCSVEVQTHTQRLSGKYSISDDEINSIFTVTIKDLTHEDSGYYWCAVKMDESDVSKKFHLSVTRSKSSLYVSHQEITGFEGETLTVICHNNYVGTTKWCRLGSSCVTSAIFRAGSSVRIRYNPRDFTVTMTGLRTESSGWYYCDKGDLQMPVLITITEKPTTTSQTTTSGFSSSSPTPDLISVTGDEPTPNIKAEQRRASVDLKSLIIPLGLLVFIVLVVMFIWIILRRHNQSKPESSATTAAEEEVAYSTVKQKRKSSSQDGEELTYANVAYRRKSSGQTSYADSNVDVMYSSVVTIKQQTVRQGEAKQNEVTYSTLAHHHPKI